MAALSKKALKLAIEKARKKADEYQETAKQACYQDDESSAQYYEGMRSGCLLAALEIELAMSA